jgi:hypothetical protein
MSLNLYQCPRCNTADIKPEHACPATDGQIVQASIVIRFCDVCGGRLEAGKSFHTTWCASAHRAELADRRQQVIDRCSVGDDDIVSYIEGAMDLAPWQKDILRQLLDNYRHGTPVKVSANSRRNGHQTLKRHWERIEKLLKAEEK